MSRLIFIGKTLSKQPFKKGMKHDVRIVKLEGDEGIIIEVDKLHNVYYRDIRDFMKNWKYEESRI